MVVLESSWQFLLQSLYHELKLNTTNQEALWKTKLQSKDFSRLARHHHHALCAGISEARHDIKEGFSRLEERRSVQHDDLVASADQHTKNLDNLGHRISQVQHDTEVNVREIFELCFKAKIGTEQGLNSAQCKLRDQEHEIKKLHKNQIQTNSQISSYFNAALNRLQIVCVIGRSVLDNLLPFSEKVLEFLRENMKMNLEIYALLLKIQQSLPPRLTQSDSIQFEDVLGRTENLPYAYFSHWPIFEAMLQCRFKGVPGEGKVLQGQYLLTDGTLPHLVYQKAHWQNVLSPGAKVRMSIVMQALHAVDGSCPRSQCGGTIETPGTVACCSICGLMYSFERPSLVQNQQDLDFQEDASRYPESRKLCNNFLTTSKCSTAKVTNIPPITITYVQNKLRNRFDQLSREQLERERQEVLIFRMVHITASYKRAEEAYLKQMIQDFPRGHRLSRNYRRSKPLLTQIEQEIDVMIRKQIRLFEANTNFKSVYRNCKRLLEADTNFKSFHRNFNKHQRAGRSKAIYPRLASIALSYTGEIVEDVLQEVSCHKVRGTRDFQILLRVIMGLGIVFEQLDEFLTVSPSM